MAGQIFLAALLQPVRSVCVCSERFFHIIRFFINKYDRPICDKGSDYVSLLCVWLILITQKLLSDDIEIV